MSTTYYLSSNNFPFIAFDDATGNLAIGTSNIDATNKLYVAGNIVTASNLSVSGSLTAVQGITVCNSTFLANSNDTAAAPSFSWRQESNTGIYHPSNNTIGFSIIGSEKLRINNIGLGLNSINPSNLLDVVGTAYISSRLGIANPIPAYALDVTGAINATTYCNILVNSFNNPSTTLAPTALALSNVYSYALYSSNAIVFLSNTSIYGSNSIVFPSNTSSYASNTSIYASNTSIYASNTVVFTSNLAIYSSNSATYASNNIGSLISSSTFSSNSSVYASNTSIFASNIGIYSSNNISFASNTSVFASNNSIFASNASAFASNTSIYASNLGSSSNLWQNSNNVIFSFCNVGIGISNITNRLEVAGNSIFYSNLIVYGTCSNTLGVSPSPGTLIDINVLTSGTLYTPSPGTRLMKVEMLGGGGAGGGKANTTTIYCGGGGAGAYGYFMVSNNISSTSNYTYSIGAGGTGVANAAGGNGGNTSITINLVTYSCGGGFGGPLGSAGRAWSGGFGGSDFTGTFVYSNVGQEGGTGFQYNTISGQGGFSPYGSGGTPKTSTYAGAGSNARGFGSGGSGAGSSATGTLAGGNGSAGFIIIHEYT